MSVCIALVVRRTFIHRIRITELLVICGADFSTCLVDFHIVSLARTHIFSIKSLFFSVTFNLTICKKIVCYEQIDRERLAQRHSLPVFFEALLQDEWKFNVAMKISFNLIARIISHHLFIYLPFSFNNDFWKLSEWNEFEIYRRCRKNENTWKSNKIIKIISTDLLLSLLFTLEGLMIWS